MTKTQLSINIDDTRKVYRKVNWHKELFLIIYLPKGLNQWRGERDSNPKLNQFYLILRGKTTESYDYST